MYLNHNLQEKIYQEWLKLNLPEWRDKWQKKMQQVHQEYNQNFKMVLGTFFSPEDILVMVKDGKSRNVNYKSLNGGIYSVGRIYEKDKWYPLPKKYFYSNGSQIRSKHCYEITHDPWNLESWDEYGFNI